MCNSETLKGACRCASHTRPAAMSVLAQIRSTHCGAALKAVQREILAFYAATAEGNADLMQRCEDCRRKGDNDTAAALQMAISDGQRLALTLTGVAA